MVTKLENGKKVGEINMEFTGGGRSLTSAEGRNCPQVMGVWDGVRELETAQSSCKM